VGACESGRQKLPPNWQGRRTEKEGNLGGRAAGRARGMGDGWRVHTVPSVSCAYTTTNPSRVVVNGLSSCGAQTWRAGYRRRPVRGRSRFAAWACSGSCRKPRHTSLPIFRLAACRGPQSCPAGTYSWRFGTGSCHPCPIGTRSLPDGTMFAKLFRADSARALACLPQTYSHLP